MRNERCIMKSSGRRMFCFAAATVLAAGCALTPARYEAAAPLKVAVFVGNGARNVGAYRWLEIATMAHNVEATPVDGAAVRAGALDSADVLIMPGGRATLEARELGDEGRAKLTSFIRNGGGYIGTCAGFYLISQPHSASTKNYLKLLPFVDGPSGGSGRADIMLEFNDQAVALAKIPKGRVKVRYGSGPVPNYTGREVEDSRYEVVARYSGDVNQTSKPREPLTGHPAAVAGECGKGRIFAFTVHPESDVDDHYLIEGAFRYVTAGREVRWNLPRRRPGQLVVGVMADDSLGVDTARFLQDLMRKQEFDLVPLSGKLVGEGELRHVDAVLEPANAAVDGSSGGLCGENTGRARDFLSRGGTLLAWGNAARRVGKAGLAATEVADGSAAVAALRALAAAPEPAAASVPGKVPSPVTVAVFADNGTSMGRVQQMLALSPEYSVDVVNGKDIAAGALAKYDMLFMPGGYSHLESKSLGEDGRKAVVEFVRGGGLYYGICGGAFLASKTRYAGDPGASCDLGLVPFKDDRPHPYRGWAPARVRITDAGRKVFSSPDAVRSVMYWGGPAFVEAEAVPDSDIEVFARYENRIIGVSSPKPSPDMFGKAAIVGGRVGKGKVFVQCPHPENYDYSFDMARDAVKYLTGVTPTGRLRDRVRGAKSVVVAWNFKGGMYGAVKFALESLLADPEFDVRFGGAKIESNSLLHADIVIVCTFDESTWTPALRRFAESGGTVVAVAESESARAAAEKQGCATVVAGSFAEALKFCKTGRAKVAGATGLSMLVQRLAQRFADASGLGWTVPFSPINLALNAIPEQ